jgi:TonB family protein
MSLNLKRPRLLTLLLITSITAARARPQNDSWHKIAPLGHAFTVMMPTKAKVISRGIQVSNSQTIPASVYYSVSEGKRFVAAGFYKVGAETSPTLAAYEQFVAGMEASLKANSNLKSLRFDRELSIDGIRGKQYELALGQYSGVVRFLESKKGLYALFVIGGHPNDRDAERFFSSFRVGEVNADEQASGVINRQVVTMVGSKDSATKSDSPKQTSTSAKGVVVLAKPVEDDTGETLPPEPWSEASGSIAGGVINGRALKLVQPKYPEAARKTHDSGQIKVQIVINEIGNVESAQALNGPESLKEAAVAAAWQCRFTPTLLMGQPVRVSGVIIYNFVAQ